MARVTLVIAVPIGRTAWVRPLFSLLLHALLDLFAQILRIVSRHCEANVMHELHLRLGILGQSFAFFHEVDVYVQLFQGKSVSMVAIQSVCLFNEQNPAGSIAFEVCHHLRKLFTTGSLGRLDLNKLAYDFDSILDAAERSSLTWASME